VGALTIRADGLRTLDTWTVGTPGNFKLSTNQPVSQSVGQTFNSSANSTQNDD